jgi:hypothetical protein
MRPRMGCYWQTLGIQRREEISSGARSHVMGLCPHPPPSDDFNTSHVVRVGINASPSRHNLYGAAPGYGSLFELVAEGALPPEAMVDEG